MDTIPDDELQRMAEESSASSNDRDFIAYQTVLRILSEKPVVRKSGIEDAVIAKITLSRKRSAFREHAWLIAGVVFLILGGVIAVAISGFTVALSGWQRNIMMLGLCGGLVIIALNALERKLLNRHTADHH
ncbi:hypothetical protein WBG78_00880 [Chryseolinea sp. T2]|uniref:hypothetical protein n=1 Tax=Chryseolinea sp. T2 TaxID=3129255 RepID=UPI003077935B